MTYPHHDADGASTFAIVVSGIKNWVVMAVNDTTRLALPEFLARLSSPDNLLSEFSDQIDVETAHLHSGDLL